MSTISMRRRSPFLRFFAPEEQPGTGGDPTPDPAPADPAQEPAPTGGDDPAPTEPPVGDDEPKSFSSDYVKKLRREIAGYRDKAKTDAAAAADAATNEITQKLGKALGLIKDDEPVDPQKLIEQAQGERQAAIDEANATKRDLAVLRNASKHDANTDELLDSRGFQAKLSALDPSADDFASQVEELIKETVASNPAKFKRVQVAAGTGGSNHTGELPPADPENKSIDEIRQDRQKRRGIKL